MAKITETKTWRASNVRSMCIKNDYYTAGDNEAYAKMLNFVDTHEPTKTNIYKVAVDIVKHSFLESYGQSEKENIESIMYEIANNAVHTCYEIA